MAKIVRGEDLTFTVVLRDSAGTPFDLTGATEITARVAAEAGGKIEKKMTLGGAAVVSAMKGQMSFRLSDADTSAMKLGDNQPLEIVIDLGETRRIVQVTKAFRVNDQLLP